MSKVKKILALSMAVATAMGMSVTAYALPADASATITIDNAGANAKFNNVQVVVADPTTETGWDIVDEYYEEFQTGFGSMTEQDILAGMISEATNGTAGTAISGFDTKYAAALDAICDTITAPTADTGSTSPFTVNSAGVYVIRGFEEGYTYGTMAAYISFGEYDTATGVPATLNNATVEAKRVPTTVVKSSDDADKVTEIGKTLTYTVTGVVPYIAPTESENAKYWVTDKITGAEYVTYVPEGSDKESVKVNVTIKKGEAIVYNQDYDATLTELDGKDAFTLDLSSLLENNAYANNTIIVSYQAEVTDIQVGNDVYVGTGANDGDYGHDSDGSFTGNVKLLKLASDEDNEVNLEDNAKLADADFVMYKVENGAHKYATVADGKLTGWVDKKEDATTLTTDVNGEIKVEGLDLGTYWFEEIEAPTGYSLDAAPVDAEITLEGQTATAVINGEQAVKFNTTLSALPGTGGIGTTIFTIGGCAIMVTAAGLYFATRKKTEK